MNSKYSTKSSMSEAVIVASVEAGFFIETFHSSVNLS